MVPMKISQEHVLSARGGATTPRTGDLSSSFRSFGSPPDGQPFLPAKGHARLDSGLMRKPEVSSRQVEVLQWVAAGKSNKEIVVQLFIAEGTVKTHMKKVFEKLAVVGRTAAIREAIHRGLESSANLSN